MPPDRAKTVTIADVARAAQVSTATVSLVLNGQASSLRISPATREVVLETVNRLGYTPNHAARSLRRRKTGVLALLVTQVDIPYHGELATAAIAAAEANGYDCYVLEARSPEHEVGLLNRLRGGRVDGALVATMRAAVDQDGGPVVKELGRRATARIELARSGTPVVALLDRSPDPSIPTVRIDDEAGALLATRHLIERGHRRIAHIGVRSEPPADDEETASAERFRGYRRALAEADLPFDPSLFVGAEYGPRLSAGHDIGARWSDLPPASATAVYVSNDLLAIGVLRGLFEAGITVPNDLAVTAFDGIELSRYTRPALTTVEHPRADLGQVGTEMLVGLIEGRPTSDRERILPVRLVVRESSGGPIESDVVTSPHT